MGRGWAVAVLVATGAGCHERYELDLSSRPDGVKIIALVDGEGRLARSLGALRVESGQRVEGPRIDLELASGEEPVVVELDLSVLEHPLGSAPLDRMQLSEAGPVSEFDGSWLRVVEPLPLDAAIVDTLGRALGSASAIRTSLRLVRHVAVDSCPSPVEPLELHVPGVEDLLSPYTRLEGPLDVLGGHAFSGGRVVVHSEEVVLVLRDRTLPDRARTPGLRDWLDAEDLGDAVTLRTLVATGEDTFLLAGGEGETGRAFHLRIEPTGLRVVATSTPGASQIRDGALGPAGIVLLNDRGGMLQSEDPSGPWLQILPDSDRGRRLDTQLAVASDGRILRGFSATYQFYDQGGGLLEDLRPPFRRGLRIGDVAFGSDGTAWMGNGLGEVASYAEGRFEAWSEQLSPSFRPCTTIEGPLDQVQLNQGVRNLKLGFGYLFVTFGRCSHRLAIRLEDRCQHPLGLPGAVPEMVQGIEQGAFVGDDRLFLAGTRGVLLSARRRLP